MRLLLLADLHLGARLPDWEDHAVSRRAELERVWTAAVEQALDSAREIDGVLVAGDLFDRPDPAPGTFSLVSEGLARLAAEKTVVLLPGTYDGLFRPDSVYASGAWPEGVTVVDFAEPRSLELDVAGTPLRVHTFASVPGREPDDLSPLFTGSPDEGFDIGLIHGVLDPAELEGDLFSWGRTPVPRADVESGNLDLLVVGGGHRYHEAWWGGTLVVQPGSPAGLSRAETGDRYLVTADLGPGGVQLVREPSPAEPVERILEDPPAARNETPPGPVAVVPDRDGALGLFVRALEEQRERADTDEEREHWDLVLARGLAAIGTPKAPHVV